MRSSADREELLEDIAAGCHRKEIQLTPLGHLLESGPAPRVSVVSIQRREVTPNR